MTPLQELKHLFGRLAIEQAPAIDTFAEGEDTITWLRAQGLVLFSADAQTGQFIGLRQDDIPTLQRFTKTLRTADHRYSRGTQFGAFAQQVFNEAVTLKKRTPSKPIVAADLQSLEANIAAWFAENSVAQRHLIPCSIIAYRAKEIKVGPVSFQHIETFDFAAFGVNPALTEVTVSPFVENMRGRAATWVALVEISEIEPVRSLEMAGLVVDVALATLQLVVPHELIDQAARITGRSMPPFVAALVNRGGHVAPSFSNHEAGRLLSGEVLDRIVEHAGPVLGSSGKRLNVLISDDSPLHKLETAWCNSAFWFHEALAEPLATVAIAKLETSIENLFGAGNPTESTNRILQALEGVFALKADEPIATGSSVKVKDFVKDVVTSRSRILHGTWSTLTEELPLSKKQVATLARQLLISFTLMLDRYAETESPVDKAKDFLDWMLRERAARAAAGLPVSVSGSP
jgi:hypothetical protein